MNPVKIETLMIRNFKRVHLAEVEFSESGLSIIGGHNNQGKSTFLDAIKFLLGGKKYAPTNPHNLAAEGATATVRTTLTNGIEVERSGKSSSLKVRVPDGKGNQTTLNEFLSEFALDIDKFMRASDKDKAKLLIEHLGIGEQIAGLEKKIKHCFDERTVVSREVKRKQQLAEACVTYEGLPETIISVVELSKEITKKSEQNKAHQTSQTRRTHLREEAKAKRNLINQMEAEITALKAEHDTLEADWKDFEPHNLEAIEAQLENAETLNSQIQANEKAAAAEAEYKAAKKEEQSLTDTLTEAREQLAKLINEIPMPLAGLAIAEGDLTYHGQKWDGMSGSQRMIVAAAISRAFKPECGFVLVDELEQLDWQTIAGFDDWAKGQGIQVIGAMVCPEDKQGDNVIIISDGKVVDHG